MDQNYVYKMINVIAKKMVEVFENLTIEDVNMYQIGYNKGIDEFAQKLNEMCENNSTGYDKNTNRPLYAHEDGTWHDLINDVVDQMEGGAE